MERDTKSHRGRPLRVLWLIDSLTAGGAEALSVEFGKGLDPTTVDYRVCCLRSIDGNPFEAELRAQGIPCINLEAKSLRDVRAFRALLRLLRITRPDVVHVHLTYASIWGPLAARIASIPCVATLHVEPSARPWWTREGARERLRCRIIDRICRSVIAVSAFVQDAYLGTGMIRPQRFVVAYNGIDTETFTPARDADDPQRLTLRDELGIPAQANVVTIVSVLRAGKGIEVLIDAALGITHSAKKVWLVVVGEGPLHEQLAKRAGALGLNGRIIWTGFRRDVAALLKASDVFVLPSRIGDAFPTALLEAMASGLPVVATRVGGIPEIVDDTTGLLVTAGDRAALEHAVASLLTDRDGRALMGKAGRLRAQRAFALSVWRERLVAIYETALREESP